MVMETPSPQCVGREFVRQYYTLLHEAPLHLHRFYSNNSSFVHGGVEKPGEEQPPVTGQANIHKKIMSLNFRDCHAKIRQVDSHATVDNAVVVQVTGELSNNGQPMRRFMQTFVLAPQSPKKYYVHNDIFRYQDEVFHDTDSDAENQEDAAVSVQSMTDSDTETPVAQYQEEGTAERPMVQYFDNTQPLSNGTDHLEDVVDPVSVKEEEEEELVIAKEEEEVAPEPEISFDNKRLKTPEPEVEPIPEPEAESASPEPKAFSWAAMASKNTAGGPSVPSTSPGSHAPVAAKVAPPRTEVKPVDPQGPTPQPQRAPRPRNRDRERTSIGRNESEGDTDSQSGRRGPRYPDENQLFVGNLPHNILEKELKEYFETFGPVVECRINTKSGGGKIPNFGFVVFSNPDPVRSILSKRPIFYNGEHRLNVEEKKPKGDGRPGSGRSGGRGGPMGPNTGRVGFGPSPSGRPGPRPGGGSGIGQENRNNPGGGGSGRGMPPRR